MTQLDEIVTMARNDDSSAAAEVRVAIIAAAQGVSAGMAYRADEFLPLASTDGFGAAIAAPTDEFSYAYEE